MNNFRTGQKVRIKPLHELKKIPNFEGGFEEDSMGKYAGQIVTIQNLTRWDKAALVEENIWTWDLRAFEPVGRIIYKNELENGDIVTYRNGDVNIVNTRTGRIVHIYDFSNLSFEFDSYNKNLKNKHDKCWDIVEVYRPTTKETFVTDIPEAKEMTIAEISKALGYEVKVVKE